jgi:N-acetyl sugar amidotransferase
MDFSLRSQKEVAYCKKCLYPSVAVNILLDQQGVCGACHFQAQVEKLTKNDWDKRRAKLEMIISDSKGKSQSGYDCVVPVSGGKDSYFQTHIALELGLRPLLVTYHGNNYLPEGLRNLERMREVFQVDHMILGPSVKNLKALNLAGFRLVGDMNWHAHAGIKTFPMQIAVRLGIPLVLWGEVTWSIAGMFDLEDYVTFSKRTVFEHDMRGVTLKDMCGDGSEISPEEFPWLVMPSDSEFERAGTIGIYIGNFFPWDPIRHTQLVTGKYGFESAKVPFERTYRTMSNLDDMHENGIHDYLKFIKFGYGRATDHASKDIRSGDMSREKGIEHVRNLDHVIPTVDLARWLEYVNISAREFHLTAEKFRDPRVWWIEGGAWWKMNVWGEPSSYGPVLE